MSRLNFIAMLLTYGNDVSNWKLLSQKILVELAQCKCSVVTYILGRRKVLKLSVLYCSILVQVRWFLTGFILHRRLVIAQWNKNLRRGLSILIRRKQDLGMFKATIFEVILGYPIFDVLVKLSMQNFLPISGRVDRASATETIDSVSIPGQVKQKTFKISRPIYSCPAWRSAIRRDGVKPFSVCIDWWADGCFTRNPNKPFIFIWPR